MALPVALDHCVVHVSDWSRSNAFYHEVMGAELVPRGEGWAYRFGRQQLNLHGPGVDAHPVARIPVPPGGTGMRATGVASTPGPCRLSCWRPNR